MAKKKKISTAMLTLIAMIVGAILGLVFGEKMSSFKFIGTIWLNCIKMILIPLIVCIMVIAVGSQSNLKSLGRTAIRILAYYLITTVIAVGIGIVVPSVVKPGLLSNLEGMSSSEIASGTLSVESFFVGLFSGNMFQTFTSQDVLAAMVIAIMLGVSILNMKNEDHKQKVLEWFDAMNSMVNEYLALVIKLSPIGVLFLMADSFGTYGFAIFTSMVGLIGTYWLACLIHVALIYGVCLMIFAKIDLFTFLKKSSSVWTFTMATCSSAATIPVSLKCAKEEFGVKDEVADFCIPLGANINMDAMAIMFGCVVLFIAQVNGISLSGGELFRLVIISTALSAIGGGIPGGGIVRLMTAVTMLGFPGEIVGIVAGFYRLFDMASTTGNCLGDLVGTVCVSKM
ncbi:MAG: dicarboxylate/amino acid:cation symporter, partial [Lachnospiraceae bacterium]|nr:dicarboxylate/amino acid:cation symporter [Lachnospiraceae bacterium]